VFRGLAFSIFAAVGTGFVVWLLRGAAMVSDPLGLVAFLFYGILFATVLALAVGIPIHLLLARRRVVGLVPYLLTGALAAFAFGLFFEVSRIWEGRSGPDQIYWPAVKAWAYPVLPAGMVGAAVFWAVVVKRSAYRQRS
jgi:hypothetical protein